jgi:hypothetical protein
MAKRTGIRKRGAGRAKAKSKKALKDLAPTAKGRKVKGGLVCTPLIAIIIPGPLLPCSPVGGPSCGPAIKK